MIQHWLHQIDKQVLLQNAPEGSIGHRLLDLKADSLIEDYPIAFVHKNMPMNFHHRVALGELSDHFDSSFIDLGYLRNGSDQSVSNLFKDLGKSHIIIFTGGNSDTSNMIINTLRSKTSKQKHVLVTDKVQETDAEQTNYIGVQRHLNTKDQLNELHDATTLSLGQVKSNITKVEPLIRSAHHLTINLHALDHTCLLNNAKNLTGLSIYEICQILKYAGAAPHLKSVHFQTNECKATEIGKLLALLSWYYLEGFEQATSEDVFDDNNKKVVVYLESLDTEITFVQGNRSGKWWLKNPGENENSAFIPCTYEDYQTVCQNQVPDKFLVYFD